ncbi:MAG: hypothetical protein ACKO23_08925 [Gemmataceae bacterium]
MLAEAIQRYHDLLDDSLARECWERLAEAQRRRGVLLRDRPLCSVLRPRLVPSTQYRWMEERVKVLLEAFARLHQLAAADPSFRSRFRLSPEEETLFGIEPGYRCPIPNSRLDAFMSGEVGQEKHLWFTEFNAETPAAAAYTDELGEIFQTLPIMTAFRKRYRLEAKPARPGTLLALLESFAQWRGSRSEPPRLAILDWAEVPTFTEFVLFQRYFEANGLECVIADPREMSYREGRLWSKSGPVNLIYKRVLISELIERVGLDHAVIRAVREGAVCLVNPFRCKPLYKKASLAMLSDEANAERFTAEQREVIAAHIPWTRVVEERRTVKQGRVIDLIPFILENRDTLVLKPNDDYGGKGIVLGWQVDAARWNEAVTLAMQKPHVVQERVPLGEEVFPLVSEGVLKFEPRLLDTAPFVFQGEFMDGCLTRLSTDPMLNVSAGTGSTVATFVIAPR